jgi:hypothetical protein
MQAVQNTALEEMFATMSPGTLYAKWDSARKRKEKAKAEAEEQPPEYYL